MLKAELANLSRIYCFNFGRFSSVAGQGRVTGVVGGSDLTGHEQGSSPGRTVPEFEHTGRPGEQVSSAVMDPTVGLGKAPTWGKLAGTAPKLIQVSRLR